MNAQSQLKAQIEEALLGARGLISDFSSEGQQKFEEYLRQAKLYKEALIILENDQEDRQRSMDIAHIFAALEDIHVKPPHWSLKARYRSVKRIK